MEERIIMSDYARDLIKAALVRALRTAAQTAVGVIGGSMAMEQVDWRLVCSSALLAAIVSILMSIAGLPEVDGEHDLIDETMDEIRKTYVDESDVLDGYVGPETLAALNAATGADDEKKEA